MSIFISNVDILNVLIKKLIYSDCIEIPKPTFMFLMKDTFQT
jgi:hypothetical protein